jgi:catechol 2,3-dioxygenase-like lactoylglutathione lyase family enzyme
VVKPTVSIITLAVDDLERSLAFYRDGLGLPTSGIADLADGGDHILFPLEGGISFVLFLRSELAAVTLQPDTGRDPLACVLSHTAGSAEEVDAILDQAAAAGGSITVAAATQPWGGYAGYFADPDGHLWEIVANLDGKPVP